jgi:hypothetical protein
MARRERFQNDASTTLDGGITAGATTVTVADGSVFPSEGDFRILIEDEILLVTARSTDDLTVERGAESTTGVTHASGTTVTQILTEQAVENYVRETNPFHGFSPQLRITNASGAIIGEADFTWVNQGSATSDDAGNGIRFFVPPAAGANVRAKTITAPSTPWTATMAFSTFGEIESLAAAQPRIGLILMDADDEVMLYRVRIVPDGSASPYGVNVGVDRFSNVTTFTTLQAFTHVRYPWLYWIRVTDNGTNLVFDLSLDGVHWVELLSESRTNFFAAGPNRIGFGGNASGTNNGIYGYIYHFSVE